MKSQIYLIKNNEKKELINMHITESINLLNEFRGKVDCKTLGTVYFNYIYF